MKMRLPGSGLIIIFAGLSVGSTVAEALEFQPGIGFGVEYTDNAKLSPDNMVNDLINIGYVGARLAEDVGPLTYNATTSFNNQSYTQDTYPDKRYFNLAARADWVMIKDRVDWFLSDSFYQRTVNSLGVNTPDNLQDSNAFKLGANIKFPLSARQNFNITPTFDQYYYEQQLTDNKQYSLATNWNYLLTRLTSVGLNLSTRKIDYIEQDLTDTTFTNLAFISSSQYLRSSYSMNLGATYVTRTTGEGSTDSIGFAGNFNWLTTLTSRSKLNAVISTDLTDTSSSAVATSVDNPTVGNIDDVQVTSDVVRNSNLNLAYLREDGSLKSTVSANYRKMKYSDSPLDREIQTFAARLNYPVTQLVSTGAYLRFQRNKQLDTARLDETSSIVGNVNYRFSRKWHSLFDIRFITRDSTDASQEYSELSAFASLVYGFGDVYRPSSTGGF